MGLFRSKPATSTPAASALPRPPTAPRFLDLVSAVQAVIGDITDSGRSTPEQFRAEIDALDRPAARRLRNCAELFWTAPGTPAFKPGDEAMTVTGEVGYAMGLSHQLLRGDPDAARTHDHALAVVAPFAESGLDPYQVETASNYAQGALLAAETLPAMAAGVLYAPWGWAVKRGLTPEVSRREQLRTTAEPFLHGSPARVHPNPLPTHPEQSGRAALAARHIVFHDTQQDQWTLYGWELIRAVGISNDRRLYGVDAGGAFLVVEAASPREQSAWMSALGGLSLRPGVLAPIAGSSPDHPLRLRWVIR